MGVLDTRSFELDDAEDFNDPSAGMDHPVEESARAANPQATIDKTIDGSDEKPSLAQIEPQPRTWTPSHPSAPGIPSASSINSLAQMIASNINPTPRSQTYDMKVGVAFEYMRVKVGDIIDLEKFTPALQELYKDNVDEAKEDWTEKKDFSDDKDDLL